MTAELKYYHVLNYGCQMNESDSEHYAGQLEEMGYAPTDSPAAADVIVVNTCCVRESAELRILGKIGELKRVKAQHPGQVLCVAGCMAQKDGESLMHKYPQIDLLLGTSYVNSFKKMLQDYLNAHKKGVYTSLEVQSSEFEGTRVRESGFSAWIPIMYGCNNFCTYCVVPYVRGRERSRLPEDVVREAKELVAAGYKDITLLGQNVNSYGKDLGLDVDFADLIRMINDIPGDFLIRFMTSHPKDATEKLFRTMAECEKCAHHIHLPVQSGSNRILKAMNRSYTREKYLEEVAAARALMPDLVLTTDIIVGFPGETDEDFAETLSLCEEVRYDAMFTFIYSKRVGTPAASMPDPYTREEKQVHFDALTETANRISAEKHRAYIGTRQRVLVDGLTGREEFNLSARTNGGRLVHLKGDPSLIGRFITVEITDGNTWALYGKEAKCDG